MDGGVTVVSGAGAPAVLAESWAQREGMPAAVGREGRAAGTVIL